MFLNFWPDRTGPGFPPDHPDKSYFDFVVSEHPEYIPGSGPPLSHVTPMPVHDKDGIITGLVDIDGCRRYVVSYESDPDLRVSVKLENILNWVSPLTLEEFEFEQTKERERKLEEKYGRHKSGRKGTNDKIKIRVSQSGVKKNGRKRATFSEPLERETRIIPSMRIPSSASVSGPGRKRKQLVEEERVFTSPKALQQSQASMSSPGGRQRGLAYPINLYSEDEPEEDAELAIEHQLNSDFAAYERGDAQQSRPASTSTEVADTTPLSLGGKSAVAGISSREAGSIYEDLERQNKQRKLVTQAGSFRQKYSNSPSKLSESDRSKSSYNSSHTNEASSSRHASRSYEEDAVKSEKEGVLIDEVVGEEYEVDKILGDKMIPLEDGTMWLHYLIKWVGVWDDSWEPEFNVGLAAIHNYERKKKLRIKKRTKKIVLGIDSSGEIDDMDEKSEANGSGKGKVKEVQEAVVRPSAYFDEDDDELMVTDMNMGSGYDSNNDEQFINDKQFGPSGSQRADKGKGKEVRRLSRGEVIDDDYISD